MPEPAGLLQELFDILGGAKKAKPAPAAPAPSSELEQIIKGGAAAAKPSPKAAEQLKKLPPGTYDPKADVYTGTPGAGSGPIPQQPPAPPGATPQAPQSTPPAGPAAPPAQEGGWLSSFLPQPAKTPQPPPLRPAKPTSSLEPAPPNLNAPLQTPSSGIAKPPGVPTLKEFADSMGINTPTDPALVSMYQAMYADAWKAQAAKAQWPTAPKVVSKSEAMALKPDMPASQFSYPHYVVTPEGGLSGYGSAAEAKAALPIPTPQNVVTAINNTPPKFFPSSDTKRMERAAKQGYTTPAYKGISHDPKQVTDVDYLSEGGSFSAANPDLANQYAGWADADKASVMPLLLNTKDYIVYNARGEPYSKVNSKVIAQAKKEGAKGVVVLNVHDHPTGMAPKPGDPYLGQQTVYITIDPGTARSKFAQFDPKKAGLNDLLANKVGYLIPPAVAAALFGQGEAKAAEAEKPEKVEDLIKGWGETDRRSELESIITGVPRGTSEPNPEQYHGFWDKILGDQLMTDIHDRFWEGIDALKYPFTRGGGSSPMELATDFLSIVGGVIGTPMSPMTGAARTYMSRPIAERVSRTDTPASERRGEPSSFLDKVRAATPRYGIHAAQPASLEDIHKTEMLTDLLLPGMGILPGVRNIAKFGYSKLFAGPKSPVQTFSESVADDLQQLRQTTTADRLQIREYVQQSPLVQKAAGMMGTGDKKAAAYLNQVQEIIYHLIEDKNYAKLSADQQAFLANPENLQATVEAAKHLAPLRLEASKIYEYLRGIKGIPADELVDPSYIHRRAVGHTPVLDPSQVQSSPITGGKQKSLPTTTTAMQERFYQAGEDASGHRVVFSNDPAPVAYEPGKAPQSVKMPDDTHFELNGKTYTIGQATTREIEEATPTTYYKNALANVADSLTRLRAIARHTDWLDDLKQNPLWQLHATKSAKLGQAKGWTKIDLPQLKDWYLDPHLAQPFQDFVKPGISGMPEGIRKINQLSTASIFWNPTPHIENVWGHWVVGRGWDWITPFGARSLLLDGAKAIKAVTTQDQNYQRLLKEGSGMIFGGVTQANFYQDIARMAGMQIAREPYKWDVIGKALGVKLSPVEWTRLLYEGSKRTLWWANDVLMMQRVLELERKGMTLKSAIKEAEKHIPNYRIPTQVMGQRWLSQIMQEPGVTQFSRYHYGVFRSYANMLRDAFGPTASMKERLDAFGNMMALGLLTWVVYPALDHALQYVTGDPEARKARRGPSARPSKLSQLYEGDIGWPQAIADSITLSPVTKLTGQLLTGHDWFTGQPITEPGSDAGEQVVQAADWAAGQAVAPFQMGRGPTAEEGGRSLGRRLEAQVLGEENTSPAAERGKMIGARMGQKRAQKRRIHPRGPLERLYQNYGGQE